MNQQYDENVYTILSPLTRINVRFSNCSSDPGNNFLFYFWISERWYKVSFDLIAEIFNDTLGKHLTHVIPSHITMEQKCKPGFQRLRQGQPGWIPGQSIWATWQWDRFISEHFLLPITIPQMLHTHLSSPLGYATGASSHDVIKTWVLVSAPPFIRPSDWIRTKAQTLTS
jgi:hypothetical protein